MGLKERAKLVLDKMFPAGIEHPRYMVMEVAQALGDEAERSRKDRDEEWNTPISAYVEKDTAAIPSTVYPLLHEEGESSYCAGVEAGRADAFEEAALVVDELVKVYPTTIFSEPPPGEHGKYRDQCSASMARAILPPLADAIRALKEKP